MVVRMRHTRSHTKNRRSHHGLESLPLSACKQCGAQALKHRACATCGTYKGREVINVVAKAAKKDAKKRAGDQGAKDEQ